MKLIIPLYIGVAMLIGLSIYDWVDDESVNQSPYLNAKQVNRLLTSHLTVAGTTETSACAKQMFADVVLEEYKTPDVEYVGSDLWVISNGLCSYTVSDLTGKVIGP